MIYNIKPLLDGGFDGTGQKIVVVGQSNVNLADTQQYRSMFGLAASDPQMVLVPGSRDPGIVSGDVDESNLDLQLSGAVARNATIYFVYSTDVVTSAQYAINQNLAPVISMSYGLCEAQTPASSAKFQQILARQAVAQGMTWVNASGDSGAADCVGGSTRGASYGLQVDVPAAIPEVTGIGGTTFNEGSGTYWASTNSATLASAMSYIPETAWNDSAVDGSPSASGGGASTYWAKPYWQAGPGVPSDGARDVPDVSLSASAHHDAYMFYSQGKLGSVGGTSVGTPVFAGLLVLLNQYLTSHGVLASPGLGNVNPQLYALAQISPAAFHDITTGDNMVNPCPPLARNCNSTPVGYAAGPGYDLVTGLGSIDALALISSWTTAGNAATKVSTITTVSVPDMIVLTTGSVTLTATVKASNNGVPTGTVTFLMGGQTLGTATLAPSGSAAAAMLTVSGSQLAIGANTISAQYGGDGTYNVSTASVTLTAAAPPTSAPTIGKLTNAASYAQAYAPGMIVAVFGSALAPAAESAASLPLPATLGGVAVTVNGVTAPLYYVSATQLNVQIPYETPLNTTVTMTVNNNGRTGSATLRAAAAAPGIFTDTNGALVPNASLARNGLGTLFITGEGAVAPRRRVERRSRRCRSPPRASP
jgi:subtilase family serine protease